VKRDALPWPVLGALLLQTLIAAGTHLAAKRATQELDASVLITLRLIAAALLFVGLLAVVPGPKVPPRQSWRWLLGFGFLAGPANQGLFLFGLKRSLASHAALLYALTPVGVLLLGAALGRERLVARKVVGVIVAFLGVVVLLLGRGLAAAAGPLVGDLFMLGAVAAWVAWTVESRAFAVVHGGFRTSAWALIASGLWLLPLAPFTVRLDALRELSWVTWGCLGYLVVLTSVGSYVLWNYALARVEASRVAVFANLQPVMTALAAWALLGEPLTWELGVGGVLVLVGVRVAQRA
jgi:drug/metabolite transporter (DMT)-like permease